MPDFLPKEFKSSHDFCLFLHDQLVETLGSGEDAEIFNNIITFKNESEAKEFSELSGDQLIEWLETSGREQDVQMLYFKQLVAALMSDFLHFVFEALSCSRKGKLTVSYALLRKPFKENLFYLEWLLADPVEFLERFDSERSQRYDFDGSVTKEERISVIARAINECRNDDLLSADFLYDLRFAKNAPNGMERDWQKANHLYTVVKHFRTEKANLNFVFSNDEDQYAQWSHLYSYLPLLLFHAVQIVECLISKFAFRVDQGGDTTPFRTEIGLLIWMKEGPHRIELEGLESELDLLVEGLSYTCNSCKFGEALGSKHLRQVYEFNGLQCDNCGSQITDINEGKLFDGGS